MKKPLIIILTAIVIAAAMVIVAISISDSKKEDGTKNTPAPTKATQKVDATAPEKATTVDNAIADAATEAPTEIADEYTSDSSSDALVIEDLTGLWKNESAPLGCSVEVVSQNGNTLDIIITSERGNAAQIATVKTTVTLDTYFDGTLIRGTDEFDYTDSFGNEGTCKISASKNVITVIVDEENRTSTWGIANATGDYIFAG